jgi:DNA repair protein RecN (Recombination protein N)
MLERLVIRDLALVEHAEIAFAPGLNVVTGETGTGKSLLVSAIDLLLGGRADADAVREGAKAAVIEGEFRADGDTAARVAALLAAWGHEGEPETLILRREVHAGGRSRASVNQSPVTLAALRALGEVLADLHGQHEHQSLLRPGAGIDALDRLARLETERAAFAAALESWRDARVASEQLERTIAGFAERREFLSAARREIDEAGLRAGEEEELAAEAARLTHADRLRMLVAGALERLDESERSAAASLTAAGRALAQAAALDPTLSEWLPAIEEARIASAETARSLAVYLEDLDADPDALERIETRREQLARLQRKYHRDVAALMAWREEIEEEFGAGESGEDARARAAAKAEAAREACVRAGRDLSRRRHAAAGEWTAKLSRELRPLGFAEARLEFAIESPDALAQAPHPTGLDEVTLRFSANPGETPRTLQKVASGGELSRIMLALKTALEAQDPVDLLLFDEVDSGIGGAVAQAVGERLKRLARHRQLVCVTHLPMIAALASHHVLVSKRASGGRTLARFDIVEGDARVDEISRMLAGARITATTRRQARELLDESSLKTAAR